MRSRPAVSSSTGSGFASSCARRASPRASGAGSAGTRSSAPSGRTRRRGCRSPGGRARARLPSTSLSPTASSISACELTSSARNIVSSASASPFGRIRQRCSVPCAHEAAEGGLPRLLHRAQQQHVGPLRSRLARRSEVVRAVEVDRVDLGRVHEARDRRSPSSRRVSMIASRSASSTSDELALRDLPALDDLVTLDLALVHRAPALLLDRRHALAVQRAERDVGLARRRLRGQREPDRDVDQAEADGAVPDRPHGADRIVLGAPFSSP